MNAEVVRLTSSWKVVKKMGVVSYKHQAELSTVCKLCVTKMPLCEVLDAGL